MYKLLSYSVNIIIAATLCCIGIFEDDDVTHVEGEVNPVRDIEIIHEELRLKDMEYIDKNVEQLERVVVRGGDKARKMEYV